LLIRALSPLVEASGVETEAITGHERRRWWESGGFALARSRARCLSASRWRSTQRRPSFEAPRAILGCSKIGRPSTLRKRRRSRTDVATQRRRSSTAFARLGCASAASAARRSQGNGAGSGSRPCPSSARWRGCSHGPKSLSSSACRHTRQPEPMRLLLASALLPRLRRFVTAPPVEHLAAVIGGDDDR
jgi:hypothetical protein